ncbi:MAG: DUF2892 domain-containing protein [Candidatus Moraniibacteriota bacterium]
MQPSKKIYRLDTTRWNIERLIFLIAGLLIATFTLLGFFVHPSFHYATLFVSGMLVFFALTGYCPMAIFIHSLSKNNEGTK